MLTSVFCTSGLPLPSGGCCGPLLPPLAAASSGRLRPPRQLPGAVGARRVGTARCPGAMQGSCARLAALCMTLIM